MKEMEKLAEQMSKSDQSSSEAMKNAAQTGQQQKVVPNQQKASDQANTVIRGKVVPADVFDEVKKLRDEYRAQHKR